MCVEVWGGGGEGEGGITVTTEIVSLNFKKKLKRKVSPSGFEPPSVCLLTDSEQAQLGTKVTLSLVPVFRSPFGLL